MTVYSMDLNSYINYHPKHKSFLIKIKGNFDSKTTNAELTADKQYTNVILIPADDITKPIAGGHIFTTENAKHIINGLKTAMNNNFDVIVHCDAGVSRTGAIVYLCLYLNMRVVKCLYGNNLIMTSITKENFEHEYLPNPYWLSIFKKIERSLF